MRTLLLLMFLYFNLNTISQQVSNIRGTVIIGAIVHDTAIIVADSRGIVALDTTCNYVLAYADSLPKIFKIKNSLIAASGFSMIGDKFIQQIVLDFNKAHSEKLNFKETILEFKKFIDRLYPVTKYPKTASTNFIAAGQMSNKPVIIGFTRSDNRIDTLFGLYTVISSEANVIPYIERHKGGPVNCKNISDVLGRAIIDYVNEHGQKNCIGGPISAAKVSPRNKVDWVRNDFSTRYFPDFTSFVSAIESGNLKMIPVIEHGREKAIESLKKNPAYRHQ